MLLGKKKLHLVFFKQLNIGNRNVTRVLCHFGRLISVRRTLALLWCLQKQADLKL